MDNNKNRQRSNRSRNHNGKDNRKQKQPMNEQTYRFRRVLGDILGFLKSLPHASSFENCQRQYGEQLTELIKNGYTWGYEYPIPVHDSDFTALEKKEWAAIRAIVRKQEYKGANPDY